MNLEQRLRALVTDERLAPGPGPDPVAMIERLVTRQRRRWWRRVTACAAAVILVAAGATLRFTVFAPADPTLPADVVAWVDVPAITQQPFVPVPATARPCVAGDFEPDAGMSPAGNGAPRHTVSVRTKLGGTPCLITGAPTITGRKLGAGSHLADARTQVPLTPDGSLPPPWDEPVTPAVIRPGTSAGFTLIVDDTCPRKATVFMEVRLRVAGRDLDWRELSLGSSCPLRFGPWAAQRTRVAAADVDGLRPTIEAPATARVGETVRYVVTLHNDRDEPGRLDPCPYYFQAIDTDPDNHLDGAKGTVSHQLNCTTGVIPARGAVRFEMRLAVPGSLSPGPAALVWVWGVSKELPLGASAPITLVR